LSQIPLLLKEMRKPLASSTAPEVRIGRHCDNPYSCPFQGKCHAGIAEDHITTLPRVTQKILDGLYEMGIERISEIPDDFVGLNKTQQTVRECVRANTRFVSDKIFSEIKKLSFPL